MWAMEPWWVSNLIRIADGRRFGAWSRCYPPRRRFLFPKTSLSCHTQTIWRPRPASASRFTHGRTDRPLHLLDQSFEQRVRIGSAHRVD